jgi:hypothetical protein
VLAHLGMAQAEDQLSNHQQHFSSMHPADHGLSHNVHPDAGSSLGLSDDLDFGEISREAELLAVRILTPQVSVITPSHRATVAGDPAASACAVPTAEAAALQPRVLDFSAEVAPEEQPMHGLSAMQAAPEPLHRLSGSGPAVALPSSQGGSVGGAASWSSAGGSSDLVPSRGSSARGGATTTRTTSTSAQPASLPSGLPPVQPLSRGPSQSGGGGKVAAAVSLLEAKVSRQSSTTQGRGPTQLTPDAGKPAMKPAGVSHTRSFSSSSQGSAASGLGTRHSSIGGSLPAHDQPAQGRRATEGSASISGKHFSADMVSGDMGWALHPCIHVSSHVVFDITSRISVYMLITLCRTPNMWAQPGAAGKQVLSQTAVHLPATCLAVMGMAPDLWPLRASQGLTCHSTKRRSSTPVQQRFRVQGWLQSCLVSAAVTAPVLLRLCTMQAAKHPAQLKQMYCCCPLRLTALLVPDLVWPASEGN